VAWLFTRSAGYIDDPILPSHPRRTRVSVEPLRSLTRKEDCGVGIDTKSQKLSGLIEEGVRVERVADGLTFTEGPIWHRKDKYILLWDMLGEVGGQ